MAPTTEKNRHQVRKSHQSDVPMVKFRSSCDACTKVKVKCDKRHPRCGRCIRTSTNCHYGVSMRTGKSAIDFIEALNLNRLLRSPGPDAQGPGSSANTVAVTELLQEVDSDQYSPKILPTDQDFWSTRTPYSLTPPASDPDNAPINAEAYQRQDGMDADRPTTQINNTNLQVDAGAHSPSLDPGDMVNMHENIYSSAGDMGFMGAGLGVPGDPLGASLMDMDPFGLGGMFDPELMEAPANTDSSSSAETAGNVTLCHSPAGMPGHSCLGSAKALQKAVVVLATKDGTTQAEEGGTNGTTPLTTIDQALMICSNISKQLIDILQCPCEADAHLPFLLAVLISKVLATYGAIARIDDSTPFNFPNPGALGREKGPGQAEQLQQRNRQDDAFAAVPLRLGAYDIDKELEGSLRAHLVVHEVAKLSSVSRLFGEKYCQRGAGGGDSFDDGNCIYGALGKFVEDRYARIRAACERRSSLSPLGK
ncbi:hypothetical protein HD806DRAFT_308858 [Xylariaceae sp. AK1471]|nr:hypothetical protein HD806DRAFT_308858 [Xylariaceae sp. AK1471]